MYAKLQEQLDEKRYMLKMIFILNTFNVVTGFVVFEVSALLYCGVCHVVIAHCVFSVKVYGDFTTDLLICNF